MEKKEKDENNVVDNSKKTNTIKYVILLLVAVLSGFLVGFGVTQIDFKDKVDANEKKEEKQEKDDVKEDKIEVRDLTAAEKKKLISQIDKYNSLIPEIYGSERITINDEDLLFFAYFGVKDGGSSISAEAMEKEIKRLFYIDHQITHQDIKCLMNNEINYVNYDSQSRIYTYNDEHPGHGGVGMISSSYTHYIEGKVVNETEAVVKTKILYGGYCGDICGPSSYYGSYLDSRNARNSLISANLETGDDAEINEEIFKTVSDKIVVTKFTFVIDSDGNYGLKSVTFE